MEEHITTDTKIHKRMEDAEADQAKNGDSCSAKRVQADPTSWTRFGMKAEPTALPRWDDDLVSIYTAVPRPCLSLVEMRTLTAAGGLLPTGKTIFHQLPLWFCLTKEVKSRTSQYATD